MSTDVGTAMNRVPSGKNSKKKTKKTTQFPQQEMAWMTKKTLSTRTKSNQQLASSFITLSKALGQKAVFTNHWLSTR